MLEQGFLLGDIRHHRYIPKKHMFRYNMYWSLLDLDKLNENADRYRFFSNETWNLLSYRKQDFIGAGKQQTKDSVLNFLSKETNKAFDGKVFILSHLRFLGFNFNSVSFYFCIDKQGELQYIISEITNTPWGERHAYLHSCEKSLSRSGCCIFNFSKNFHISPFVSMDMNYQWLFKITNSNMRIHMKVTKKNKEKNDPLKVLDVTFTGKHLPLTQANISKLIFKNPFQPLKMIFGIYWQALRLWFKKVPFYSHPKYENAKSNQDNL